jgi:hypothetical protein
MDVNRFAQCCQAFGAERRRWPAADQALYDQFAGTTSGAALLADAKRTDNFLDAFKLGESTTPATEHHLAVITRPVWSRYALQIGVLSICAVMGVLIGYFQVDNTADIGLVAHFLLGPNGSQE